jgi:hypothetical protein
METPFAWLIDGQSSGAVAQLGERLICIQEVIGSIPFSSTSIKRTAGYTG